MEVDFMKLIEAKKEGDKASLKEAFQHLHSLYKAAQDTGFTRGEAMELIANMAKPANTIPPSRKQKKGGSPVPRAGEIDVKEFVKQKQQQAANKIPIVDSKMKHLSTKDYATLLGKHPVTIAKWLIAGRITGAVKVGRQWRIPVEN